VCQDLAIEGQIREFLAANFFLGDDPSALPGSASLIEAGIIDSTGVLELVGFLEETFDIRIAEEDLVPENLDSIHNILAYVQRKQQSADQAA
jgi:acyl carrier protein